MTKTHLAYLLLGSNQGDRKALLKKAVAHLREQAGAVTGISALYETEPWGNEAQPPFLNVAVALQTDLSPEDLLGKILDIELQLGRTRSEKWEPRTIDIDILLYDEVVLKTENLTLPHPHMHERNFALIPLIDLAPEKEHPILKKTIETLYWESKDTLEVIRLDQHLA